MSLGSNINRYHNLNMKQSEELEFTQECIDFYYNCIANSLDISSDKLENLYNDLDGDYLTVKDHDITAIQAENLFNKYTNAIIKFKDLGNINRIPVHDLNAYGYKNATEAKDKLKNLQSEARILREKHYAQYFEKEKDNPQNIQNEAIRQEQELAERKKNRKKQKTCEHLVNSCLGLSLGANLFQQR